MIRVLVADDEPLSLNRLTEMLGRAGGVEIVGQASNGPAAVEKALEFRPDAIFLDIEMPILDGFDVVEAMAKDARLSPLIVFVTAYPQFAANAFDTGAIDFLTKPIRLSRVETAVARVRDALEQRDARARLRELAEQLEALRAQHSPGRMPSHLWVQKRGQMVRLDLAEIDRISAEGEYVRIHVPGDSFLHRSTIGAMAERLGAEDFIRIHRSAIVARARIAGIRRRRTGGYEVETKDGATLPVGRLYRGAVRSIVEKDKEPG